MRSSKKRHAAFLREIRATIGRPADEVTCNGGHRWLLDTGFGQVSVSVHALDHATVFLRFWERNPASDHPWVEAFRDHGVNVYSGKWNIHMGNGSRSADDRDRESAAAIAEFQRRLALIGFTLDNVKHIRDDG